MRLVVRTSAPRTLTSNYRYNIAEYAGGMGVAQKHHATTAMRGTDLSERVVPTRRGPSTQPNLRPPPRSPCPSSARLAKESRAGKQAAAPWGD